MFKVECMVDDKKLADVLKVLVGKVLGPPAVTPVINATLANGHIKAETRGNLAELFVAHLKKAKLPTFKRSYCSEWLKSHGKSPTSADYVLRTAIEMKAVRRTGTTSNAIYHLKG